MKAFSYFIALVIALLSLNSHSAQLEDKVRYRFNIATYNVRNFTQVDQEPSNFKVVDAATGSKAFAEVITEMNAEIIAFQEVINGELFERLVKSNLPEHKLLMTECGGTADQKIALAYDARIFELEENIEDWRVALTNRCNYGLRPALVTILKHRRTNKRIATIAVHLKAGPGERNRATRRDQHYVISTVMEELTAKNVDDIIVLGDFNTTSYFEQTPGAAQFENFLQTNSLVNTGKDMSCSAFWEGDRADGNYWPSHLDHILHRGSAKLGASQALAHCARTACRPVPYEQLGDSYKKVSDHCPVRTQVRIYR